MKKSKNLSQYDVRVSNNVERDVAMAFYRRASKRGIHACSSEIAKYVGMCNNKVCCGSTLFNGDNIVEFVDIAKLADTPLRKAALKAAFKQFDVKPLKPVQSDTSKLPLVKFSYPHNSMYSYRLVHIIECGKEYITGYEGNQFKKFKRSKVQGFIELLQA